MVAAILLPTDLHAGRFEGERPRTGIETFSEKAPALQAGQQIIHGDAHRYAPNSIPVLQFSTRNQPAVAREFFKSFLLSRYLSYLENKLRVHRSAVIVKWRLQPVLSFRLLLYPKHWFW